MKPCPHAIRDIFETTQNELTALGSGFKTMRFPVSGFTEFSQHKALSFLIRPWITNNNVHSFCAMCALKYHLAFWVLHWIVFKLGLGYTRWPGNYCRRCFHKGRNKSDKPGGEGDSKICLHLPLVGIRSCLRFKVLSENHWTRQFHHSSAHCPFREVIQKQIELPKLKNLNCVID